MNIQQTPVIRFRLFVLIGFTALCFLVFALGGWSVNARIAGAVISSGTVEVSGNRQVVQHPTGGVVEEILVRDGDAVEQGDVLLRLEGDTLLAELEIVEGQYFELIARKDRLAAQRDEREEIEFHPELIERAETTPDLAELMQAQVSQYATRRGAIRQELDQLEERHGQILSQLDGLEGQRVATDEQIGFMEEDLASMEALLKQGLTQSSRVLTARRELSQLRGARAQILSEVAEMRGALAETEIEKLKLSTLQREEAIDELRDVEYREIELRARRRTLKDDIARLEVRAPVAGIVYNSAADTIREVMKPAEPILYIVPQDVELIVRTRIEAAAIDQVRQGQSAILRFAAFDARTTPDMTGHVEHVSADVFLDEVTGQPFYRTDLAIDAESMEKLDDRRLLPGMPVEAFISTEDRTPLSYFTQPLADYFYRAFRER